jgi:tetratricopeptide (TPR) repeat protein
MLYDLPESDGKGDAFGKNEIAESDLKNHIAWYKKGFAYFNRGKLELAIDAWNQTVQLSPNFADAYHELGVAYGALSRYDKAAEYFEKAISLSKEHTLAHYNLGVVFSATGQKEMAVRQAKELRRYDPVLAEMLSKQLKRRYKQSLNGSDPIQTSAALWNGNRG